MKSSRKTLCQVGEVAGGGRSTQNSKRQHKTWPKPAGDGVERSALPALSITDSILTRPEWGRLGDTLGRETTYNSFKEEKLEY